MSIFIKAIYSKKLGLFTPNALYKPVFLNTLFHDAAGIVRN